MTSTRCAATARRRARRAHRRYVALDQAVQTARAELAARHHFPYYSDAARRLRAHVDALDARLAAAAGESERCEWVARVATARELAAPYWQRLTPAPVVLDLDGLDGRLEFSHRWETDRGPVPSDAPSLTVPRTHAPPVAVARLDSPTNQTPPDLAPPAVSTSTTALAAVTSSTGVPPP